ncbi:MAG: hypothetical protein P8106_08160 [Gammaproteobacteria bacterium]
MTQSDANISEKRIVVGFLADEDKIERAVDRLVESDFPLDRLSVLGNASSSGDDPLGVYYKTAGERIQGWGSLGAIWGGIFGAISGAAGLFVVPGAGALLAAGPLAEALVGAAAGAGLGGGVMAGGAALTNLAVAAHRMGIPSARLDEMHQLLEKGNYLILLIVHESEVARWQEVLKRQAADPLWVFPYLGVVDAVEKIASD